MTAQGDGNAGLSGALERGLRLASVLSSPGGWLALMRWRPFSISAFRLVRGLKLEGLSFHTIVDVGANAGQFSAAAAGTWPAARIIAFEPLPSAAAQFRSGVGQKAAVEIHEIAIGDRDGTSPFHPHEYSLASSLLPSLPGRHGGTSDGGSNRDAAVVDVPIRRLDTALLGVTLNGPVLLKLDVQGAEPAVLAGGAKTLEQVDALLVEVAFERAYEGQALFPEVHDLLQQNGWLHCQPIDWRRERSRIVEADFLYRRADPG